MTVSIKSGNFSKLHDLAKFCTQATKTQVKVHIKDPEVATYANYVEFGWVQAVTPNQRKWFGRQGIHVKEGNMLVNPPRPFFYGTVEANRERWQKLMRKNAETLFKRAGHNMTALTQTLMSCGMLAVQDIQDTVLNGKITNGDELERRAPITMELYANDANEHGTDNTPNQSTTDKPLYHSGRLAASIGYDIVTKE